MASNRRHTHCPFELPIEIWDKVIQELDRKDMGQVRLVNRNFSLIAKRRYFETVPFDLSEASITQLTNIASAENLPEHVRTLKLKRPRRLPIIPHITEWLEYHLEPEKSERFCHHISCYRDDVLAAEGWSQYKPEEQETLYEEYKKRRNETQDDLKSLSGRLGHTDCVDSKRVPFKNCVIRKLYEACSKFTKLTSFIHEPGIIWEDRWVERLPGAFLDFEDNEYDSQEDHDTEGLGLGYALLVMGLINKRILELESMGLAGEDVSGLKSITFGTRGPAFWGLSRLHRLQQGHGHSRLLELRQQYKDVGAAERHMEQQILNPNHYDRQLDTMKEALRDISNLDCSISEKVNDGGLSMVTGSFLEFLCRCKNLQKLFLTFGHLLEDYLEFEDPIDDQHDAPKTLLTSLSERKPWPKIQELKLKIVTDQHTLSSFLNSISATLHHLTLSNIHFGHSKGMWESALFHIASDLKNLKKMDAENLREHGPGRWQVKTLFDPKAKKWEGRATSYNERKQLVIGYLLQTKQLHEALTDFITFSS